MPKQSSIPEPDSEIIAEEVVEHDHDLANDVRRAKRDAQDAKERSGEAVATLNQWRWEMTRCPLGPMYSQRGYAEAVKQGHVTIQNGAAAWQAHLDASESVDDRPKCSFGDQPHDQPLPPLTTEQVQSHDKARRRLDAGEVKAIIIERLAAYAVPKPVVPTTIEVNYRAMVNEALTRFNAENDPDSMTPDQIISAADALARTMWQEFKLRKSREGDVQRWMTRNRAADSPVSIAEARKMVDRIERQMEKNGWNWATAERDAKDWDYRRCEAERLNNELARKARVAVLDLMQSSAQMKLAAIRLATAMQQIANDNIPLSEEENEVVQADLADIEMVVRQAKATVTGKSGVNWDAAMTKLVAEDEVG
jgi:hypothetical protein